MFNAEKCGVWTFIDPLTRVLRAASLNENGSQNEICIFPLLCAHILMRDIVNSLGA